MLRKQSCLLVSGSPEAGEGSFLCVFLHLRCLWLPVVVSAQEYLVFETVSRSLSQSDVVIEYVDAGVCDMRVDSGNHLCVYFRDFSGLYEKI